MKNSINAPLLEKEPAFVDLQHLSVRALGEDEYQRAGQYFNDEHYLGDLPRGRSLLQVVEEGDRWVALLDWGPAAWKLADREIRIGWTAQQRSERIALVVQNRRLLVLGAARMPNLASKALSLATKALPDHWEAAHGYRPLLAETFTDIESYAGTCYKATGWEPCGMSKGFARLDFDRHGRIKKYWIKSLNRNSWRILRAIDVPKGYRHALNLKSCERDLPLKKEQMLSLRDYLRQHFEDPRRVNRTYPASGLLTFMAMGMLAGRNDLAAIQRYGQFLTQQQRKWLCFPCRKGSSLRKTPSYKALWHFVHQIDPEAFAACLNRWLAAHVGQLPRALAVDGKWVRDRALSLCLSEHESGAPVAVGFAKVGDGGAEAKREGEQSVAKRLYEQANLENAVVTGDALYCDQHQARAVLEGGGDYLFQIKNENRQAWKAAQAQAELSPLLSTPNPRTPITDASTGAP